jgi:acyl-CoA hydrolase
MAMKPKFPLASRVEMTQIVLPSDANALGTVFGGKVMQWIDVAAAVAARRHALGTVVTASMDSLQFIEPVQLGDVVVLYGMINRAWRTSMEIGVRVECEKASDGRRLHAASAYLTFVALDEEGRPRTVGPLQPQSDDEKRRFEKADDRRKMRLAERGTKRQ